MKYFLSANTGIEALDKHEVEVTREEFIKAERQAGFYPKGGGDHLATGGFSGGGIRGRIKYEEGD